ncbi:MAG: phosphatidylglycerol lysyltransferase domain-containing protein [Actinomycetota bacterium]
MTSRRPKAESLLAWAAALVGLIGIVSALTPELADRVDLVDGVLPPGVPEAARVLTLSFGIALVWLSRSLAKRRRRAWQLAVVVVAASGLAHLAKGLDFEEATATAILLAALIRWRSRFDVPGDRRSARPLVVALVTAAAAIAIPIGFELRNVTVSDRIADVVTAVGLLAGFAALYLWLRPLSESVAQTVAEHRLARDIVEEFGRDSLSFFALRRDKSFFFSPSQRSFLAYRVVGGTAIVSGDPVGEATEFDTLLAEFRRVARASGWRFAVVGVSAENLPRYERLGMKSIAMGDEAVLIPSQFSLDGRAIRKVRQSVSRLTKAGYTFRVVHAEDADRPAVDAVSCAWRGASAERGFSMAMDDLYAEGTLLALAEDEGGELGGFLHLAPAPAHDGWSLSTMRRRPGTPNGLTEFLIVEAALWAKETGASELSLNFCALSDFIDEERATTPSRRLLRRGLLAADNVFQLERLHSFSRKFHPEWRPRYVCVEKLTDLPLVGLAYLHLEQLLVLPGPWARAR